eukprot:2644767-Pyramimonas_sp.AAC.1
MHWLVFLQLSMVTWSWTFWPPVRGSRIEDLARLVTQGPSARGGHLDTLEAFHMWSQHVDLGRACHPYTGMPEEQRELAKKIQT